jgi:hypothetical protein
MAKVEVHPTFPSWEMLKHTKPMHVIMADQEDAIDKLPQDEILSFPRGDGQAIYQVKSLRPLVLWWIPYGDCYRLDPFMERGLRRSDVEQRLYSARKLKMLFGKEASLGQSGRNH